MADVISVSLGYNNPGGLIVLPLSPDTDGVLFPRVITPANQFNFYDGWPYCDLRMPDEVDPQLWVDTEALFGISYTVASARVTVRLPDPNKFTFHNYNAIATHPQRVPFAYYWYTAPTIRLRRLVAI